MIKLKKKWGNYINVSGVRPIEFAVPPLLSRSRLTGALVTACGDDAVRVFKEEETTDPDQPVFLLAAQVTKAHSQDVNCVSWNPKQEGLLASCSDDGEIAIWRFQEEEWKLDGLNTNSYCKLHWKDFQVALTDSSAEFSLLSKRDAICS